jgi:type IV secretory pathway TraG/TraD family ATPase VirD4
VVLAERDLLEHTVVFGATGSGKTNTLRLIAGQAIAARWPVIVLDLKGDVELANELERMAVAASADFELLTIRDDPRRANWNPIAVGSANARADRLIVGEWSEEHYERTARDFARSALTLLDLAGETTTIPTLVRYLEQPDLLIGAVVAALNKKRPAHEVAASLKQERERFAALLTARTKDRSILSATAGLAARLRELSESDLRPALTGEAATSTIDLARTLTTDAGVVCFSLDSASDPSVATLAGSLALRDLQHAISARPSGVTPALVLLDEFSVLESDEIKSLLARARSKRVGVVLSTQSLADLTAVDLNLKTQTLSNTATKIIHRLGGDEEPELIASLAGTRTVEEFTHQTIRRAGITGPRHTPTGTGSARRVEEYNLHPNRLRDLKRGHAAVILRAEPQWKGYVRIDNADKRLREISRYRRR